MEAILKATGLKKYYGKGEALVKALDGVDLEIERGKFTAIIGTSGSGKSTLLNMLGGLDTPSEGSIQIGNTELAKLNSEQATIFRRNHIGFIFQDYNLIQVLNVYENIMLPLQLGHKPANEKTINFLLDKLHLTEKKYCLPSQLSGGEQQRVAIIRALIHQPDLIVADALYLNAPFINTVLSCGMETVIRLKDEKRLVFKDAQGLFEKGAGKKEAFKRGRTDIETWDLAGFEMDGVAKKVRVIRYHEKTTKKNGRTEENWMWLGTTDETADNQTLWKIIHKRWDIEENGFHQLKTYYHLKHCYCHKAVETVFYLIIIAFNMKELYLYRRTKDFKGRKITLISVSRMFQDELHMKNMKNVLYESEKGG